jgi:hypothetical protein
MTCPSRAILANRKSTYGAKPLFQMSTSQATTEERVTEIDGCLTLAGRNQMIENGNPPGHK